jgi:hypothetical protein
MSDTIPHAREKAVVNNFDRVPKCGAKEKRTGDPCDQPAMSNGRCRLHGGKALKGIAHPNFKGKGYSEGLPYDLIDAFETARADPELLQLRDEIALVQTRIKQLIQRLTTGEAQTRWKDVKDTFRSLKRAQAQQDKVGYAEAIDDLGRLLSDADQDYRVWDDLYKAMHMQGRLIAQEQKRLMDMNALVSADQAVGFVTEVMQIVAANVTDKRALQTIEDGAIAALRKRPSMHAGALSS